MRRDFAVFFPKIAKSAMPSGSALYIRNERSRVYLKTGNMPNSKGFFNGQAIFSQEYLLYFKGKWCSTAEKDLLFGRIDDFQIDPNKK